jgi:hypothetical protein
MSSHNSLPQVLECPACGATLALPDADTFLCDYCGKRIIVPSELRPKKPEASSIVTDYLPEFTMDQVQPQAIPEDDRLQHKKSNLILVLSISIAILLLGGLAFIVFLLTPTSQSPIIDQSSEVQLRTTPLPTLVQFARLALVFGTEGSQPGEFDDARSIAVDNLGNIFVADYTSGRINKFDSQGNFLKLIQLQPDAENQDIYIPAIAADELGNLYVVASGQILKFDAASGEKLLTIPDQWPEIYYDSVVMAPDGNLYATNGMAGADDVIILSPQGELLAHWVDTISTINHDDPAMLLALGVNHAGRVYILSPMGNQVYTYNPDGTYNSSFGEEGENPGQFNLSTGMLAINQQDDLVISDVYRVDLFDENGIYLGESFTIDYQVADGSMYGMTMDVNDDLFFISSGGKVLKFDMNYP